MPFTVQGISSITVAGETIYGGEVTIDVPGGTLDPETGEIVIPTGGASKVFTTTLTLDDITNKFFLIDSDITVKESTKVEVHGLAPQFYGTEYVVDNSNSKKIKWNGLGLDGLVQVGDIVTVTYF